MISNIAAADERYLTITADQTLDFLYIDEVRQLLIPNGGDVSTVDNVLLPPTSRLVAVQAMNLFSPACSGILASATDDYFITNSEWKCSNNSNNNWFRLDFDDSHWPNAMAYRRDRPGCTDVDDISENAEWIWSNNPSFDIFIFCRGYIKRNLTFTAYQTLLSIFINGIQQSIQNGGNVSAVDIILITSTDALVAVQAINLANVECSGILASATDDYLLTSSEWKCSADSQNNWFDLNFDDSLWSNAVVYDRSSCFNAPDLISENAQWIWTNNPIVAYCRGYINSFKQSSL